MLGYLSETYETEGEICFLGLGGVEASYIFCRICAAVHEWANLLLTCAEVVVMITVLFFF